MLIGHTYVGIYQGTMTSFDANFTCARLVSNTPSCSTFLTQGNCSSSLRRSTSVWREGKAPAAARWGAGVSPKKYQKQYQLHLPHQWRIFRLYQPLPLAS